MTEPKQVLVFSTEPWGTGLSRAEPIAAGLIRRKVFFVNPPGRRSAGIPPPKHITVATMPNPRFLRDWRTARFVKSTVARAGVILACVPEQAEFLKRYGKPVFLLPEGVDFDLYNGAEERNLPFPDDLFNVKNPIIGHMGPVDGDVDLSFFAAAARAYPDWAFVFVGPVRTDLKPFEGLKNIHMLGAKPPPLLPVYISRFDVCVNAARSTNASPQKLYQYLATGKPIVSTPHPTQALDYTEAIYLAGTSEEFIACLKRAVGERDAWRVRRRVEFGRTVSWESRVAELEREMLELGIF